MKRFFNWNNLNISLQAFFVLAALMLFYFILSDIAHIYGWITGTLRRTISILMPFIIGFSIAYLLNPGVVKLEELFDRNVLFISNRPNIKRVVSIIITYIIFIGFLGWFVMSVLPQFYQSILSLANQLTRGYSQYQAEIYRVVSLLDINQYMDLSFLERSDISDIGQYILQSFPIIISTAYSFTSTVFKFVMGIIISVYILFDKERFIEGAKRLLYLAIPKSHHDRIMSFLKETNRIFKAFFVGKTLDSVIIGILCFAGLVIMDNPYPIVISVIIGITNMIPYFGPFIGAVPGVIITFIYSPQMALWLILFIFALQQFDGLILGPKILGDSTGIEPFWVLLAIIVGGALFGVLGMLLGVPVFAVIFTTSKRIVNRKYDQKIKQ